MPLNAFCVMGRSEKAARWNGASLQEIAIKKGAPKSSPKLFTLILIQS